MKDIIDKNPVIAIIRNISDSDILPYMMSLYHAGLGALRYLSVMGMP